jgi:hypothetical protein
VNEPRAWLFQAKSDFQVGCRVLDASDASTFCHSIAKFQQTVEKSIKALICSLVDAGMLSVRIGYAHDVERFISVLIRMRRPPGEKSIQAAIRKLLAPNIRGDIRAIDRLAPRRASPGQLPARNAEYPFQAVPSVWRAPAQDDVFEAPEAVRFRQLAFRLLAGCDRIMAGIERRPT